MTELMKQEVQEVVYLFLAGLAVMLLFRIRDQLCRHSERYPRLRSALYLLFWIFAAYLTYQFAYRGAYGVVSWYSLPAFGAAIVLWKKGLCDIITLYNTVQKQLGVWKHEKKKKRTHSKVRREKRTKCRNPRIK